MSNNKEKTVSRRGAVMLAVFASIGSLLVGAGASYLIYDAISGLSYDERKLIEEYRLLKDEWLFGNEESYLSDYALAGLAQGVASSQGDDYTFYTQTQEEQNLSVSHGGFGFTSHTYDGGIYITEIHEGPAKGKLEIGDVIYGCNRGNEGYYNFSLHTNSEVNSYLSDSEHENDSYIFDVLRGEERINVSLKKGEYSEVMVRVLEEASEENNYTLTIKIPTFLGNPSSAVNRLLTSYTNKRIDKLVIDLRQNGGGYVSQCASLAKLFVKKGTLIYQMRGKDDKILDEVYQTTDPIFKYNEYGIIIDGGSASASETFVLAMRAGTECTVYGLPSYGKGIAQNFLTFSDGSTLRYTYAYVYGPERENETMYDEGEEEDDIICIHNKGIYPDRIFSLNYPYFGQVPSVTSSIGVSEASQNFVLNLLKYSYDDESIPESYSATYHFTDAISDYSKLSYQRYQEDTLLSPYNKNGTISLPLFNKMTKDAYDLYLKYYDNLTEVSING